MPGGDRTGPGGFGPMTGRAAGYCAGYPAPGYMNPTPGYGYWGRRGGGRGWRNMYYATGQPGWVRWGQGVPAWGAVPQGGAPPPEQELDGLKAQAEWLQSQLEAINARIGELSEKEE